MKKTLALTIDFINEIVHPKGAFGVHNAERLTNMETIKKVNQIIKWAREHTVIVAHVKIGFYEGYQHCPTTSPLFKKVPEYEVLKLGSWATDFYSELDVEANDPIIIKHRINAFYNTNLETLLRANKIERLVVCGVSTTYAIESTVRDAHDRDYEVVVISDACNAGTEEDHNSSLAALSAIAQVETAKEFVQNN